MFDSYNREINYLRVAVTDRCNLRCRYCMPSGGITLKSHSDILSYEKIITVVQGAAGLGIGKIRLTGGEPLVRKNIAFLIRELKAIPGISEVSMTSNGTLLDLLAEDIHAAGIDRLNISLDTLDAGKYRQITRNGDIERVFSGIDKALKQGFRQIKINMVLLPGFNHNEVENMKSFCLERGLVLQRINHYSLNNLESIAQGFAAERPLPCNICNRLRLTADGKLKPCLFSDREIAVDCFDIPASLERAVQAKPKQGVACRNRENWQIGG
jgi:cyclic pyranopterin phosphate synthase